MCLLELRAWSFLGHSLVMGHLLLASPLQAHPLQAEPINHPYVFTFDQFNLPEDPDEHVVDGGHLLLAS